MKYAYEYFTQKIGLILSQYFEKSKTLVTNIIGNSGNSSQLVYFFMYSTINGNGDIGYDFLVYSVSQCWRFVIRYSDFCLYLSFCLENTEQGVITKETL